MHSIYALIYTFLNSIFNSWQDICGRDSHFSSLIRQMEDFYFFKEILILDYTFWIWLYFNLHVCMHMCIVMFAFDYGNFMAYYYIFCSKNLCDIVHFILTIFLNDSL